MKCEFFNSILLLDSCVNFIFIFSILYFNYISKYDVLEIFVLLDVNKGILLLLGNFDGS